MTLDYVKEGFSFKGRALIGPDEETEQPPFLEPSFCPHQRNVGMDGLKAWAGLTQAGWS